MGNDDDGPPVPDPNGIISSDEEKDKHADDSDDNQSTHSASADYLDFSGKPGEDVTIFLRHLKRKAAEQGVQNYDRWLCDEVETALAGPAQIWWSTLDTDTQTDFDKLRRAMLARFGNGTGGGKSSTDGPGTVDGDDGKDGDGPDLPPDVPQDDPEDESPGTTKRHAYIAVQDMDGNLKGYLSYTYLKFMASWTGVDDLGIYCITQSISLADKVEIIGSSKLSLKTMMLHKAGMVDHRLCTINPTSRKYPYFYIVGPSKSDISSMPEVCEYAWQEVKSTGELRPRWDSSSGFKSYELRARIHTGSRLTHLFLLKHPQQDDWGEDLKVRLMLQSVA